MAQFKPYIITNGNVNNLPIKQGQFIFDQINKTLYIDTNNSNRELVYENILTDDILTYDTQANFPAIGQLDKLYIDTTTNFAYYWNNNTYQNIYATVNSYTKTEIDNMTEDIVTLMQQL